MRRPWAIYAITTHGIEIAGRLAAALGDDADLFVSEKLFAKAPAGAKKLPLPMGPTLAETFTAYDCHVHVISVGAVVRMVAPLLQNKKVDPAILCVDDAAKFAICVLSGHVGRGNAFTERVARALDATPVITTASDVRGTLTVDILGRDLGWTLEDMDRNVTRGCAAVVNGAPVLFVQEAGEPDWWPLDAALPPGVHYATTLEGVDPTKWEILLIASDRELRETDGAAWHNAVVYRPRSLVLGLGCDKLTPPALVERGVRALLVKHGLALASVRAIATIDLKRDEPALLELAARLEVPLLTYPAAELDAAPLVTPSAMVMKHVGTRGVAEPAALLGAGATALVVPKQIYTEEGANRSMTLAVARVPHPRRSA
ncbi:MAG: cobalamin biosynthesis protein CbiG [Myxococcales bacterium]|nr:cobalamin biosynthesis protein CbiG [Myxococcales bacterium]